jgi:hypothetical protein
MRMAAVSRLFKNWRARHHRINQESVDIPIQVTDLGAPRRNTGFEGLAPRKAAIRAW